MKLTCYKTHETAAELIPARPERSWMDATTNRFAYRCTPMTMVNALGWELLVPQAFTATWTGGNNKDDMILRGDFPKDQNPRCASSHFGHGVLTFHPGYLFRTDPGWGVIARGSPNRLKDGIIALEGYVESDWLPFPFTMNWRFTRPGTVQFAAGEPFCFVTLMRADLLEQIEPVIRPIEDEPVLNEEFKTWRNSRSEFNAMLAKSPPANLKDRWQKFYIRGQTAAGGSAPETHKSKRATKAPAQP